MLIGIDPILSPDLLRALRAMGHGDEIVIADGNYAAEADATRNPVIELRGYSTMEVVRAVLKVMPLDDVDGPSAFIIAEKGKKELPRAFAKLARVINKAFSKQKGEDIDIYQRLNRDSFHARAQKACYVVATDDPQHYRCVILRKGALPEPARKRKKKR